MAKVILVESDIREGQNLANALVREGYDVTSAGWMKNKESGYWHLYLSIPSVDQIGRFALYQTISVILEKNPQPQIDETEIKLLGSSSRMADQMRAFQDDHLGGLITQSAGSEFDAVVYPRLPQAKEFLGRSGLLPDQVTERVRALMQTKGPSNTSSVTLRDGSKLRGVLEGMKYGNKAMDVDVVIDSNRRQLIPVNEIVDLGE